MLPLLITLSAMLPSQQADPAATGILRASGWNPKDPTAILLDTHVATLDDGEPVTYRTRLALHPRCRYTDHNQPIHPEDVDFPAPGGLAWIGERYRHVRVQLDCTGKHVMRVDFLPDK